MLTTASTGTRAPRRRRGRAWLRASLSLTLPILLVCLACGPRHGPGRHGRHHGFASAPQTIQVVTTQVGGKNVFIPSTIVVTSGGPVTLSLFNTTDAPHGFAIPELDVRHVLPAGEEYAIELPELRGHQVLPIHCHLHTAHRTATLVVLPGRRPER